MVERHSMAPQLDWRQFARLSRSLDNIMAGRLSFNHLLDYG